MGIKKKILIGVIVASSVTAGTYGALKIVRSRSQKPVKVYKMSEVAQTDYWGDDEDNYGTVASDQVQHVFLTGTQTVKQVFVQKGQHVKAGDPLLAYDTTLSQINIERAENEVNQQKRSLTLAKNELLKMQKTKPIDAGGKTISPSVVPGGEDNAGTVDDSAFPEDGENEHHNEEIALIPESSESDEKDHPEDQVGEHHSFVNDMGDQLDTNYQGQPIGEARSYDAPALLDGVGTVDRPAIWLWSEKSDLTEDVLKQFFNETLKARKEDAEKSKREDGNDSSANESQDAKESITPAASFKDSDHDVYIVLRQYMESNPAHKKIAEHGLHLELKGDSLDVTLFNPGLLKIREKTDAIEDAVSDASSIKEASSDISGTDEEQEGMTPEEEDDLETGDADGSENNDTELMNEDAETDTDDGDDVDYASMTRKELNKAINDQKDKIRDQTITEKLAEVKLRQMKHELSDGIVRSRMDGVVKSVRNPDKAYETNKACVTVSNGGGMTVTCAISELSLSQVKKGMEVTVTSQESGNEGEGKVISISNTPASDGNSYGSANNPNVSYYNCTVQLPDDADFKESEFVSVSFSQGNEARHGLFLDGMFIRSDENGSYIYKKGKDGRLKKSYIRTGRDIGSGTMEILGGVTVKDRIAFPYGTGVADGARTKNASMDQLYGESGVG